MKKTAVIFALILIGCSKKTQEPVPEPIIINNTAAVNKLVEIFITYGNVNGWASVKWSYVPEIDSSYNSNNTHNRTIKNTTSSDSIILFTNSGVNSYDNITVTVNGIIKYQYVSCQKEKVIKL